MKLRLLVVIPILAAVAFMLSNLIFIDTEGYSLFLRVERTLHRLFPLVGCLIAMSAFQRDDYMFRAWAFIAGCSFFLLTRDYAIYLFNISEATDVSIVTLANASNVIGYYILAKTWRVAGLKFPGSETKKVMIMSISIGAALLVGGTASVFNVMHLIDGDVMALKMLASSIADLITFCLIAPLLLTALALRGGILVWPWALITVSRIGWLGMDVVHFGGTEIGLLPNIAAIWEDLFRSLGAFFTCSAGIAQYLAVKARTDDFGMKSKATIQDGSGS